MTRLPRDLSSDELARRLRLKRTVARICRIRHIRETIRMMYRLEP